ncbi:MAG: DUF349 domain-containing protein [Bacteroidales bacterium]
MMNTEDKQQFNSQQDQNVSHNIDSVTKHQDENPVNDQPQDEEKDQTPGNNYEEEDQEEENREADSDYQNEQELPGVDYTEYSRDALVKRLREILENDDISDKKREIDIIKATFYRKHRAFNEEQKKAFINKGGTPEEFKPEKDPLETELKELLKQYKDKKNQINKEKEEEKKRNLEKKNQVIEELKNLVNKKESLGQTFKEFRELQKRWREIGPVPQNRVKDLWGTYHHHVEKFYDYVKINKELRDLDLKKNLEAKLDLCEQAEKLDEEEDIVYAFKTLQKLHDKWREIGPVPNEKKEEIWQRFKEATSVINKKHQNYFKELRKQQNANLEAKTKLCEKAEEIAELEINTHKDWNHYTKQILDLQKEWRTIGFAPKKHNNKIYRRFRKACDRFFAKKRVFYSQHKEWQENNLKKKEEFVQRAEELKDNIDWENTAKELIELQKAWKEIGPVPKKHSEEVWKRFRNACDHFFQRKKDSESTKDKDFDKNLKLKKDLIEEIKNYYPENHDTEENLDKLQEFEERWAEIGFVPYKYKDQVQQEYREAMYDQYNKLDIDENERELLKYRSKIRNIQQKPKAENRIRQERDKFLNKIKKLETNIITWENNLGFISAESTEASDMIHDFQDKIQKARKEIELLEEKIKLIDQLEDE